MLIFNEDSTAVKVDSLTAPMHHTHMWVLDMAQQDFMLSPINMVEESNSPAMQLNIGNFDFIVPCHWNILVYDRDTSQLDVVEASDIAGREFTAFVYGPRKAQPIPGVITVKNYFMDRKHVNPTFAKHQMMCHPISTTEWVVVGPSDGYNKYLKDIIVGDLIG